jgi:hypothetical protein
MLQVINAQNILIMKLLHKQNLLYQDLQQTRVSSDSSEVRPSLHTPFPHPNIQKTNPLEQLNDDSSASLPPISSRPCK